MIRRLSQRPLLLAVLALAGQGCSRSSTSVAPVQVCASDQTLGRIRSAVFEQAAEEASSQTRYALNVLEPQVQIKLVRPRMESYDRDIRKTSCTADLDIRLPVGVAGSRELQSAIRYQYQPTADGRDVVVNVSGVEQIASGIAGADLSAWADAHAPRKPGLIVEVVPRGAAALSYAEESPPPTVQSPPRTPSPAATRSSETAAPVSPAPPPPPSPRQPVSTRTAALGDAASPMPREEGSVRVFVHVRDASGLPAADHVRAELANFDIDGAPVATPPVRFVSDMPRRTEVRCLKRADCSAARRVAAYLARQLEAPIAVVDMSSTYESDAGVRPGSLELWLK